MRQSRITEREPGSQYNDHLGTPSCTPTDGASRADRVHAGEMQ